MIDQNEVIEPDSKPLLGEDVSDLSQIDDINLESETDHTKIKVISHIEDFKAIEHEWNELAGKSNTHIFQTYEWNRIWWKHFGNNKKLHVVVVYSGNKLVGIAPFFEDDVSLFGQKVYSCLRFIGSYVSQPEGKPLAGSISYSDYLDCIIHPGYEQIFHLLMLQHFDEIDSVFDEIILDEVFAESSVCNTLIPLMALSNYGVRYSIKQASSSPVIQLDSTWEAYLNSMNVKDRYNARRYYKRSKKGSKKVFQIEKIKHSGELTGVLKDFIRMHQQQWNNRGFPGTFSERRMLDFFIEVARSFHEKDWIEFNMAIPTNEAEDIKYVAVDVFLTYKNRVYLMHRGMDEDPLYRKQGPGNVLLYARLHEAINDGVKVFDMLRGSEEFKMRLATNINQNKKIIIGSNYNTGRMLHGLVKKYLTVIKHIRMEELHIEHVFNDKSFFTGITDYTKFLYSRIKTFII